MCSPNCSLPSPGTSRGMMAGTSERRRVSVVVDPDAVDLALGSRETGRASFELGAHLVHLPVMQTLIGQLDAGKKSQTAALLVANAFHGLTELWKEPTRTTGTRFLTHFLAHPPMIGAQQVAALDL